MLHSLFINFYAVILEHFAQIVNSVMQCCHLACILLALLSTKFHSVFLGLVQILIRLHKLIYFL